MNFRIISGGLRFRDLQGEADPSGMRGPPDKFKVQSLDLTLLGGQGYFVSRLIMGITVVIMWLLGLINLLTKSP